MVKKSKEGDRKICLQEKNRSKKLLEMKI